MKTCKIYINGFYKENYQLSMLCLLKDLKSATVKEEYRETGKMFEVTAPVRIIQALKYLSQANCWIMAEGGEII